MHCFGGTKAGTVEISVLVSWECCPHILLSKRIFPAFCYLGETERSLIPRLNENQAPRRRVDVQDATPPVGAAIHRAPPTQTAGNGFIAEIRFASGNRAPENGESSRARRVRNPILRDRRCRTNPRRKPIINPVTRRLLETETSVRARWCFAVQRNFPEGDRPPRTLRTSASRARTRACAHAITHAVRGPQIGSPPRLGFAGTEQETREPKTLIS